MDPKRARAYGFLLIATLIWGMASPIIKFTLEGIPPFQFLAYRFLIAGVVSALYLLIFRPKMPKKAKEYLPLFVYGFVAVPLALGFLFMGLEKTTVLEFGLIGAISPLVVALGGAIFFNEKIEYRERKGILIALTGTLLTVFAPIISGQQGLELSGNFLIIMFLLTDAAGVLIAKKLTTKKYNPVVMTNIAFIVAAIVIVPYISVTEGLGTLLNTISTLSLEHHLGVWYMAILSGSIAYYFFIRGQKDVEASEAGLFFYLHPVISFPIAILWLGEKITPLFIIGAIVITIGVFIAEYRPRRKRQKSKQPHHKLH